MARCGGHKPAGPNGVWDGHDMSMSSRPLPAYGVSGGKANTHWCSRCPDCPTRRAFMEEDLRTAMPDLPEHEYVEAIRALTNGNRMALEKQIFDASIRNGATVEQARSALMRAFDAITGPMPPVGKEKVEEVYGKSPVDELLPAMRLEEKRVTQIRLNTEGASKQVAIKTDMKQLLVTGAKRAAGKVGVKLVAKKIKEALGDRYPVMLDLIPPTARDTILCAAVNMLAEANPDMPMAQAVSEATSLALESLIADLVTEIMEALGEALIPVFEQIGKLAAAKAAKKLPAPTE